MRKIVSEDGKRRVEIASDDGNLFCFTEYSDAWSEDFAVPGPVWTPTHVSGLYDSAEAAELEAYAILPWLRGLNSN